jgi:hypothetical protein
MSNVRTQLSAVAVPSTKQQMQQRVLTVKHARVGDARRSRCAHCPGGSVSASLRELAPLRRAVRPLAASVRTVEHRSSESRRGRGCSVVRASVIVALLLRLQSSNPSFERTSRRLRRQAATQVKR